MNNVPTKTKYIINKTQLFATTLSDGQHKHTLSDGTTVQAHVEGGRIIGYAAHDSSGKPLPMRRLKLTDATKALGDPATAECMYCICREFTCKCWVEPCLK